MHPATQLALSHDIHLEADRALVVDPPAAQDWLALAEVWGDAACLTPDVRVAAGAEAAGRPATLGMGFDGADRDLVVLYLPKAKRRRDYWLQLAARAVVPAGRLVVVGHKREGIKSARVPVAAHFEQRVATEVGKHCQLIVATRPAPTDVDVDGWWRRIELEVGGRTLVGASLPGVFSDGKLDVGTRVLLRHLQFEPGTRVLDLGCGWGALAAAAAAAGAEVEATDVDWFAVRSTERTAELNELSIRVACRDVYDGGGPGYDVVVCNPPFHRGVKTEYGVAERIVREAPKQLRRHGQLWIVANRFLPYGRWLADAFPRLEEIADEAGFRVYRAER